MGVLSAMAKAGRGMAKSKSGLVSKAGKTVAKIKSWEPVKAARTAAARRLREVRKSGLSARSVSKQMTGGTAQAKNVGKGQRIGARIHAVGSSKRVRTAAVAGGVAYVAGRRGGRKAERKRTSR